MYFTNFFRIAIVLPGQILIKSKLNFQSDIKDPLKIFQPGSSTPNHNNRIKKVFYIN